MGFFAIVWHGGTRRIQGVVAFGREGRHDAVLLKRPKLGRGRGKGRANQTKRKTYRGVFKFVSAGGRTIGTGKKDGR